MVIDFEDDTFSWRTKLAIDSRLVDVIVDGDLADRNARDKAIEIVERTRALLHRELSAIAAFAAHSLYSTYLQAWAPDEDELLEGAPPRADSEEDFMKRIEISGATVVSSARVDVCFDDDEMFLGHQICVEIVNGEPKRAAIEG